MLLTAEGWSLRDSGLGLDLLVMAVGEEKGLDDGRGTNCLNCNAISEQ